MGRPSKLTDKLIAKIKLLAEKGCTLEEMASICDINVDSIHEWKKKNQLFSDTLKTAKDIADDVVEASLYKRANGMKRKVQKLDKDGNIGELEEELPPDPTSMIFWLKNRKPKEWRDRQEVSGPDGGPVPVTINWGKKPDGERS